jgi:ankyrin repeat protein
LDRDGGDEGVDGSGLIDPAVAHEFSRDWLVALGNVSTILRDLGASRCTSAEEPDVPCFQRPAILPSNVSDAGDLVAHLLAPAPLAFASLLAEGGYGETAASIPVLAQLLTHASRSQCLPAAAVRPRDGSSLALVASLTHACGLVQALLRTPEAPFFALHRSSSRATLLHAAAFGCPDEVLPQLLALRTSVRDGADARLLDLPSVDLAALDVNVHDEGDVTPLHMAAAAISAPAIRNLTAAGAVVSLDSDRRTPLHYLCRSALAPEVPDEAAPTEAVEPMRALLALPSAQAAVAQVDVHGHMAIHYCVERGQNETIATLLEGIGSESTRTRVLNAGGGPDSLPPLLLAFRERQSWTAKYLLEVARADPNVGDVNGTTPLHDAATNGWPALAQTLVDHGANPNAADVLGRTPVHYATLHGSRSVLSALLATPTVDVRAVDRAGDSPLAAAAAVGTKAAAGTVALLLDHDETLFSDDSLYGEEGHRVWHAATTSGAYEVLLVALNGAMRTSRVADVHTVRDTAGRTPLEAAIESCASVHPSAVQWLLNAGAVITDTLVDRSVELNCSPAIQAILHDAKESAEKTEL